LPAEAKRKRKDGRAPIPTTPTDIFEATATEATVYSGPVPAKHFPLDLTLMLGRGSRDRQIIILPLPSQGHWNTFIYMDADESTEKFLSVAEVLAHYALSRMILLTKGFHSRHGRVEGILKAEKNRRQKSDTLRARRMRNVDDKPAHPSVKNAQSITPRPGQENEVNIDPFAVQDSVEKKGLNSARGDEAGPRKRRKLDFGTIKTKRVVKENKATDAKTADDLPAPPDWDGESIDLTPELVLSQSGELPALPKAACHIMAVIEDPRTTATKLELALAMDQALTAKVLRIANSPFYGAVREIKTVSEAIVRLGFVSIRNWTLVTAARSVFLAPGAGILFQKIWQQSVMSAMAGQLVAQVVGKADPEAVFIGGLMQNIGQLVLARSHPELFLEILTESTESGRPYHVVEQDRLGFDHGDLGALLIKEWNLSQELEEAVRWHHKFQEADAVNQQVAAMIALGEEIALTASGEEGPRSADSEDEDTQYLNLSDAARYLGVTPVRLDELREKAKKLQIDPHFFS
jgi:HD-like signal output (HDOD) protein